MFDSEHEGAFLRPSPARAKSCAKAVVPLIRHVHFSNFITTFQFEPAG
jgi:hypothetical protein